MSGSRTARTIGIFASVALFALATLLVLARPAKSASPYALPVGPSGDDLDGGTYPNPQVVTAQNGAVRFDHPQVYSTSVAAVFDSGLSASPQQGWSLGTNGMPNGNLVGLTFQPAASPGAYNSQYSLAVDLSTANAGDLHLSGGGASSAHYLYLESDMVPGAFLTGSGSTNPQLVGFGGGPNQLSGQRSNVLFGASGGAAIPTFASGLGVTAWSRAGTNPTCAGATTSIVYADSSTGVLSECRANGTGPISLEIAGSAITALTGGVSATGPGSVIATVNLGTSANMSGTLGLANGGTGLATSSGLTVGNADYVASGTTRAYSALSLGGGAGWVTGTLPLGNEASPTGTGVALVSGGAWAGAAAAVNLGSTTYVSGTLGLANGGTGLATSSGLVTGALLAANSGTTIAYSNLQNLPSEIVAQGIFADGTNVEFFNTSTTDCGTAASGVVCIHNQTTAPTAFPIASIGLRSSSQFLLIDANGVAIGPNANATSVYSMNQSVSTSAGSGATGNQVNFSAQAGQPATGAGNNGGNGGATMLLAPVGGSSGSATAGATGTTGLGACGGPTCIAAGTAWLTMGGTGDGITMGANGISTATGTVTPTAAQASLPLQLLTATLTANLTVDYPNNTNAIWWIDISGLTFSTHSLILECGTGATSVTLTALTTNDNILMCRCKGSSVMVCNL